MDITANVDILKDVAGVNWSISANVNYNKNEITKLFNGLDEYVLANTGLKLQVGKPYGEYFYNRWAGVDPRDGYNMWYDKNGNLTKTFSEDDAVLQANNVMLLGLVVSEQTSNGRELRFLQILHTCWDNIW